MTREDKALYFHLFPKDDLTDLNWLSNSRVLSILASDYGILDAQRIYEKTIKEVRLERAIFDELPDSIAGPKHWSNFARYRLSHGLARAWSDCEENLNRALSETLITSLL